MLNLYQRLWIYQQERFPVLKHGLLIAVFSGAAVSYSAILQGRSPRLVSILVAFLVLFCSFLQLRIADEFKDQETDRIYRSERPVPRGLVSLKELAMIGLFSAIGQLLLTLWLSTNLIFPLALIWLYFGLMCQEFFVRKWLKANPLAYLLSHIIIIPLMSFYAIACESVAINQTPSPVIIPFLAMSLFNGIIIEIGRKIKAPQDEKLGSETYTAVWGNTRAILTWLFVLGLTSIGALLTAQQIHLLPLISGIIIIALVIASTIAFRFLKYQRRQDANQIELISGLWTLIIYFSVGFLPIFL